MDRNVRITAKEYGEWWAQYDLSGLAPGQEPSEELKTIAAECDVIICSTMPRAIETAAKIVGDATRIVPRDAIFVEAPLPAPPIPFLKLNPTMWGRVSRVFWFLGFAPNGMESHLAARRRVKRVIGRLVEYAERGEDVLLAAHGYLNWMIDGEIRRMGWQRVQHHGGNDFWSFRAYRMPARRTQSTKEALTAE
ncbi:histidine phosphatase family protein [Parvularcula marina]|uniref:Histidine phosphatase family protein n=2 Tax=Parvularcula marina TaxID=2292771 RepID=A0A371REY5_9PROT|nr:histidine phosphatase family protein [Parvularcula marina]